MTVYLLRHARAGRRSAWKGDDVLRPLSKVGKRQANGLVELLDGVAIEQIWSSPYVRCRQSVVPLAKHVGIGVDDAEVLAEGAPLDQAWRLIEKAAHRESVLCTHGDVVQGVLAHLVRQGVKIGTPRFEKGSMWALETSGGTIVRATYVPPPVSGK